MKLKIIEMKRKYTGGGT